MNNIKCFKTEGIYFVSFNHEIFFMITNQGKHITYKRYFHEASAYKKRLRAERAKEISLPDHLMDAAMKIAEMYVPKEKPAAIEKMKPKANLMTKVMTEAFEKGTAKAA